jgi:hypothetical protein
MSRSLPTTLAARAHREEGQCFFEGRTLKVDKSRTWHVGTRRLALSKRDNNNNNNKKKKKKKKKKMAYHIREQTYENVAVNLSQL